MFFIYQVTPHERYQSLVFDIARFPPQVHRFTLDPSLGEFIHTHAATSERGLRPLRARFPFGFIVSKSCLVGLLIFSLYFSQVDTIVKIYDCEPTP